jgi:transcriptional regulator with XRE-family HTH domain
MGQSAREKPARLGEKLLHIRLRFGLSQNEMIGQLGLKEKLTRENVSAFERGIREPSLLVLLQYARASGIYIDALVDDSIDLPAKLPASSSYRWSSLRSKKN